MRSIYEIQKDIARAKWVMDQLILEKKLTMQVLMDIEEESRCEADSLIRRLRHHEDCGK